MRKYILPLLRENGIRLIQAAKHGLEKKEGYTVLSDTYEPYEIHIKGDYRLSDNMLISGTVPRVGRPHFCALRWKGEVLDSLFLDLMSEIESSIKILTLLLLSDRSIFALWYTLWLSQGLEIAGQYIGYNAEETGRIKDQDYGSANRKFSYPLIEWGMGRQACIDLIHQTLGVQWRKSCCRFCPFQRRASAIEHYQSDPQSAAFALWCEFNALAMNPRMRLFERYSMRDICEEAGLQGAIAEFEEECELSKWAVYRVRRIYRQVGNPARPRVDAARNVETLATGSKAEMLDWLKDLTHEKSLPLTFDTHWRAYSHIRDEEDKVYPAIEGFWVASPALIQDKCARKDFDSEWRKLCLQFYKEN